MGASLPQRFCLSALRSWLLMAKRRRTRKTVLARQALEEYLARQNGGTSEPLTVGDLAGHLFGCIDVEGPSDFSSNKKYFEGFGE